MNRHNIFPLVTLVALSALEVITVVKMAQSLLEQEEAAAKEEAKEIQKAFKNMSEDLEKIREEAGRKETKNERN